MIAVNTDIPVTKTRKVRCPECRGRICDMVIDDCNDCFHTNRTITTKSNDNHIIIKCQKCGMIVGLAVFDL